MSDQAISFSSCAPGSSPPAQPTAKAKAASGIAVIDYLRGMAALGVALFHVRVPLWAGWREITAHPEKYSTLDRVAAWLSVPTPFMGSFVMLFFVISGFCVHLPQAGKGTPLLWRGYFWRRFFRIYPPYFAAVILSVGVLLVLNRKSSEPAMDWRQVFASAAMLQNYTMGEGGERAQLATNPALWSLPVEMELYLVYPLLLVAARRWGWMATLVAVAAVSLAATAAGAFWLPGNFAMYWIVWCVGAWLAEKWTRGCLRTPPWWCSCLAGPALVAAMVATAKGWGTHWIHFLYGVFYAWSVWFLLTKPSVWNDLPHFLARGLCWLGQVSYSFYLIHFPILILMGAIWVSAFGAKPANYGVGLLAVALSGVFAAVFYRLVERPSHRLARNIPESFNLS